MATAKKSAPKKADTVKKAAPKKAAPAKTAPKKVAAKKDLPEELHTTDTVLVMSPVTRTFKSVAIVKSNAQDTAWPVDHTGVVHLHEDDIMSFTDHKGGRHVVHPDSWILLDEDGKVIKQK